MISIYEYANKYLSWALCNFMIRYVTSNIIVISLLILIISPEFKHNFLLSSSTVFIFSILGNDSKKVRS